jgi:hypothetical protein
MTHTKRIEDLRAALGESRQALAHYESVSARGRGGGAPAAQAIAGIDAALRADDEAARQGERFRVNPDPLRVFASDEERWRWIAERAQERAVAAEERLAARQGEPSPDERERLVKALDDIASRTNMSGTWLEIAYAMENRARRALGWEEVRLPSTAPAEPFPEAREAAREWGKGLAVGAKVETPTGMKGRIYGGPRPEPDGRGWSWLVYFNGEDRPRWWMDYGLRVQAAIRDELRGGAP